MPLDLAKLPVLLAGPILRRVEQDLVSVWIATSRACDVSLLLFEGSDIVASETPDDDRRAKWVSAPQPTKQIGTCLHVLTVVLDLHTTAGNATRSSGGTLEPNLTYSYDLQLFDHEDRTRPHTLRTLDLLEDPAPLGYDPGELPSFKTCPLDLDRLVIVHGSCRQMFAVPPVQDDPEDDEEDFPPPGGWPGEEPSPDSPEYKHRDTDEFPANEYPYLPKRDGMLWIDTLIEQRGPVPFVDRPHQLILTGDQIYADQPAAVLLPALHHIARMLVGPEDVAADPTGNQFVPLTLEDFPPQFRADIVRRSGGLTTDDGESHLISFGEFIAYYLLAWSPELWDLELWPDDFARANVRMPEDWRVRFMFDDDRGSGEKSEAFRTLVANLPGGAVNLETATDDDIAQYYFGQKLLWAEARYWSPALFEWWMRRFKQGLRRVRRALANVPTYMVPDDHDISDDWNFNRQWREQVFTRPLGVDIVRNGMMAITVMQAWGNDPRRWSQGFERELLDRIVGYPAAMAAAAATEQKFLPRELLNRLHELLGLPQKDPISTAVPTFRPLVEYSFQIEGPCHRLLAVDGRTKRRFPTRTSQAGGIDYEGANGLIDDDLPTGLPGEDAAGVFGDSPMAAALPPRLEGDTKQTIVVTGVPVIGPDGLELALQPLQRLARMLTKVDAEAWSYEPSTSEALLAAMARYESVVVLSGDVHIGYSAVLDYWSAPPGGPIRTARIAQLVSSGLTKDWGKYSPSLRNHALTLDVFESATNPALMHAERVGWGSPLRMTLEPPPVLGPLVSNADKAHPFYRARLKMRSPIVPTHGWPVGTTELREPNWAWRAVMVRDIRGESTLPPTAARRWTPVELPADPIEPAAIGWHAHAARRQAYGRVFAVNSNVGIVTFEKVGDNWSVRHVLAGELPPMLETGTTPTGLQPFIAHQFSIAPLVSESWETERPRIVDDGGWGADPTEPLFALFVECLPRIWQGAAGFADAVYRDLPTVMDDVTREALITDAATRVSRPFRRRVLRDFGPFALKSDAELDAITAEQIAALVVSVGKLDVEKEARALVRPDLERLLTLHQSVDPAVLFDDLLLLASSSWVYERSALISTIAGVLATLRSPITRHVPALRDLLSGIWDLWRNRTAADYWTKITGSPVVAALFATPPRLIFFALQLVLEAVVELIQDHAKRRAGGPPILTPELTLAAIGAWQSYVTNKDDKRFTLVSGWELRDTPVEPGTRAEGRTRESIAKQTLSLLVHPDKRARYTAPAQKLSISMLPPLPPQGDEEGAGSLVLGWDGGFEAQTETKGGIVARVELDGRGMHEIKWEGFPVPDGRIGRGTFRNTYLRPIRTKLLDRLDIRITPSVSLAGGIKGGSEEDSIEPAFTFRVALNDIEDRVRVKPADHLLGQILPTDGLELPVDAAFEWTIEHGWRFAGFGELASPLLLDDKKPEERSDAADFDEPPDVNGYQTAVVTPIDRRIGALTFHERRLDVTSSANQDLVTFNLTVSATVSVNVGPVRIAVSGLGATFSLGLSTRFESANELIDVSASLPMPTGLAVSIDSAAVAGGGFLQRIEAPDGEVTWRGGMALRLGERYDVAAWGVVETGGGRPYTLLAFLSVRFDPPLYLNAALNLVALGGVVALNRRMDANALRDAATGRQGTSLDALLFPERPEERFLELLPNVERFFPPAPGHQVFGLLANIEWRADSGTKYGEFKLALLGDFDSLQFGLYGTARFGFPKIDDAHILRVRAAAEAFYDHRAQLLRVSFTLIEALLFESVHLTGGAALLLRWGDRHDFVFTIGGFHPAFRPYIPEGLREPPRLGAFWKPHRLVDLSIRMYFAQAGASWQFGFAAHVELGASWGGIRGDAEINFIVMLDPVFLFEADLSLRVTAFLFGADLISASLSGLMKGPTPWSVEATISWEVCGVSISKHIGPHSWGEDVSVSTQAVEARQVIGNALEDRGNWTLRRSARMPVRLRGAADDALDPRDELDIRQAHLPLGVDLEVHDANTLSDAGTWTLQPTTAGLRKVSDLTDVFPTRRYLRKPPKQAPFRPGLISGMRVGGNGWNLQPTLAVASDEESREDLVLDSLPVPPKRERGHVRVPLERAVLVSAPAHAPDRKWTRHAMMLETVG